MTDVLMGQHPSVTQTVEVQGTDNAGLVEGSAGRGSR